MESCGCVGRAGKGHASLIIKKAKYTFQPTFMSAMPILNLLYFCLVFLGLLFERKKGVLVRGRFAPLLPDQFLLLDGQLIQLRNQIKIEPSGEEEKTLTGHP
jgi:hypothetical protein